MKTEFLVLYDYGMEGRGVICEPIVSPRLPSCTRVGGSQGTTFLLDDAREEKMRGRTAISTTSQILS